MVQMKAILKKFIPFQKLLYIPHGSDESSQTASANKIPIAFISHMVQMKDDQKLQEFEKVATLYPTWFR